MPDLDPSAERAAPFPQLPADRRAPVSDARLRRLFDASVVGIVISNNAGAILEANDAFLGLIGYTRAELDRGAVDWRALTPPEWLHLDERAIGQMAQCGRFEQYEKEYVRRDGTHVPVSLGGARITDTADEQICYIVDLSAIRETQAALRDSERRYRMLAEALPQVVMLSDAQRRPFYVNRHYVDYTGIDVEAIGERWREAIHPDDLPLIERARADATGYDIEYRLRRASDGVYRWHYARIMPIPGDAGPARWLATAMEIDDRKRAEQTLRFIARAGSRLSQSLDLDTTFRTLLDLVVPEFGDWATISLRADDGRIKTIAARHRDPAQAAAARELCGAYCYSGSGGGRGTGAVYLTGAPQLLAAVTHADLTAAVQPAFVETFEKLGYGSLVALPIVAGDAVIGSFSIVSTGDRRRYTSADLPGLEELARRAGFAIANARMYEREHRVAESLQAAALPRSLPVIDGVRFDAFYQAGRQEAVIGGDWFDALVAAEGRIVVSVGDVAGSGLQAAVQMGNVRQILRGAAHIFADPMMMLEVADRTLRSEHENSLVTAFIGVIDPARTTLHYACAGHVPALLRDAGGCVHELHAAGLPLGCRDLAAGESRTVALTPGSSLLLYTDGLVEWNRDVVQGMAALHERFARLDTGAAHPAERLVGEVLPQTGARDDVAALTVTVLPAGGG